MKISKLSFPLFLLSFILSVSDSFAADCFRVHLTDKTGAKYCALSERSMQRRERQGIALDSTDVCVSPLYKQQLQEQGWQIVTDSRWLNTVVVSPTDGQTMGEETLRSLPFVRSVERVAGQAEWSEIASSKWRGEWQDIPQAGQQDNFRKPVFEVKGEALHEAGFRGEGMLITILDGGFKNLDMLPFLMGKVVGWYDCYAPSDVQGTSLWMASNHGTMVLSTMATDSTDGVWGTAPDANYFVIRTEFESTETPLEEDMWVHGAEMADSLGTDLINSSLGYYEFDDPRLNHTWEDLRSGNVFISHGARIATQKGILVCNSAGNERQKSWQTMIFPADVEEVFTLGGFDEYGIPSYFTSVGWTNPYVKPDVSCRGTNAWVISAETGRPKNANGTSFASPFMCGLMASLWSADPSLTPAELKQIVRESAAQNVAPDSLLGHGAPDFKKALLAVRPDLLDIEPVEISAADENCYSLQGKISQAKGLCIRRRKVVFVR